MFVITTLDIGKISQRVDCSERSFFNSYIFILFSILDLALKYRRMIKIHLVYDLVVT